MCRGDWRRGSRGLKCRRNVCSGAGCRSSSTLCCRYRYAFVASGPWVDRRLKGSAKSQVPQALVCAANPHLRHVFLLERSAGNYQIPWRFDQASCAQRSGVSAPIHACTRRLFLGVPWTHDEDSSRGVLKANKGLVGGSMLVLYERASSAPCTLSADTGCSSRVDCTGLAD